MGSKVTRNGCQIKWAYKCGCELHLHYACVLLWANQNITYVPYVWCSNCLYIAYHAIYHNMLRMFIYMLSNLAFLCHTIWFSALQFALPWSLLSNQMPSCYHLCMVHITMLKHLHVCMYMKWCCINIGYTTLLFWDFCYCADLSVLVSCGFDGSLRLWRDVPNVC